MRVDFCFLHLILAKNVSTFQLGSVRSTAFRQSKILKVAEVNDDIEPKKEVEKFKVSEVIDEFEPKQEVAVMTEVKDEQKKQEEKLKMSEVKDEITPDKEIAMSTTADISSPPDTSGNVISKKNKVQGREIDETIYSLNKNIIDTVYDLICFLYPVKGTARDYARFYVLETVARVPYFAYLSVMHLRETFGERYDSMSEQMRTHYAEADNELHHLLIMESLGGNSNPIDRFLAQTMAFFYYWYVIVIYAWNEPAAYHLSELIEDHAYNTYNGFLRDYGEMLKKEPVPEIAHKYYERDNPFLFDLFCTVKDKNVDGSYSARRPRLNSLYDVFVNIRDDEKEHWKTLCNLVQFDDMNAIDAADVKSTTPSPAEQ